MTLELQASDCPVLPRGVRLKEDRVRGGMVLLAPEKAVALDDIGTAILSRVDGKTPFGALTQDLATTYGAPLERVEQDVQTFLTGLRARMFLAVSP